MKLQNSKDYIGRKVKIVSPNSGHGIKLGTIVKIEKVNGNQLYSAEYPNYWIGMADVEVCAITKEEIDQKISELNAEIEDLKSKQAYMIENNLTEYNETQFKVFQTLKTLDNKELSQMERSKIIAGLIEK